MLSRAELVARFVQGEWTGKTIKELVDDDDVQVIFVFTDGTFGIVDPDPEGEGCGVCLDCWWANDKQFCEKINQILAGTYVSTN